ncbi:MAG: hypothetical protein HYT73_02520 [Candidatus Aenigmarchaeota archaeon]|nr:hypothetical protein [Candidatus Aenigmarchaeota archaeon]
MSNEWCIISVETDTVDALAMGFGNALLPGPDVEPLKTYTVQHEESGETRQVVARDEDELGEKISRGEFWGR